MLGVGGGEDKPPSTGNFQKIDKEKTFLYVSVLSKLYKTSWTFCKILLLYPRIELSRIFWSDPGQLHPDPQSYSNLPMVLMLDGDSEIGAHVRSNL